MHGSKHAIREGQPPTDGLRKWHTRSQACATCLLYTKLCQTYLENIINALDRANESPHLQNIGL